MLAKAWVKPENNIMRPGEKGGVVLEVYTETFEIGNAIQKLGAAHAGIAEEMFHAQPPYEIENRTVNLALEGMRKTLEIRALNHEVRTLVSTIQSNLVIASAASEFGIDTSDFSEDDDEAMGDLTTALIRAGIDPDEYYRSKGLVGS